MQTEASGSLLLFVKNLTHTHIHARTYTVTRTQSHTHAHKFKKCNIPLTEMTIYWWFLLFAIYFNSARKCIADVTPCAPPTCHTPRHVAAVVAAAVTVGSLLRPAKVDAANKQNRERERERACAGQTDRQRDKQT